MEVLMVEHFSPGNAYTEELTKLLCKYIDITVVCRSNANNFNQNMRKMNILYSGGATRITALVEYLNGIVKLRKELKNNRYRIIHVQTFKNARVEMSLYKKKRKETKLVHTVHNLLPHEAKDSDKKMYRDFYDFCDALIVHNEECRKQLINNFSVNSKKIYVIPHGAYSVEPSYKVERKSKKVHYLMFGVIRHYKGVDVLLKAIAEIPFSERQKMEFIIAGRQYINQNSVDYNMMIEKLGISDCVQLINRRIADEELPELFGWADVCVFPYREIYGSGALLMAYAYNKPVITSDVPVFVEETDNGRTGILFKNEDSTDLAKVLRSFAVWSDDEILNCGQAIAELVTYKYNWAISAKKTYEVYKSLIE